MERKTGTPIEKWDDINGNVPEPEPEVVEQPVKLPQEQDPNIIGNVRRGLEDQLEQNDNMIGDGVINNLPEETIAEKEERTSTIAKLRSFVPEKKEREPKLSLPQLELE